ncbi:MAG: hypothetical protein ACPGWS_01755 [Solirubrobacterales bacterium]
MNAIFSAFKGSSNAQGVEALIQQVIQEAKGQQDEARRKDAERLLDFYSNRIAGYLKDILEAGGFKKPDEKMPTKLNLLKKYANTKAQMFSSDPELRMVIDGELSESDQQLFDWLMEEGGWIDKVRLANVWEKLLGTFHIRVHPVGEPGAYESLNLNLIPPHNTIVRQSDHDPTRAEFLLYRVHGMADSHAAVAEKWVFWSDDQHFLVDGEGRVQKVKDNPDMENPYGVMPIVKISDLLIEDDVYWAEGAQDVLSANEAAIVGLVSLTHGWVHTGFKQMWARNFAKAALEQIGADVIIAQEGVPEGEQAAEIGTVDLTADLDKLWETVQGTVQLAALLNDIPPQEFRLDAVAESGFSKLVSRLPLLEERKRDVPKWRRNFRRMFAVIKTVWNHHADEFDGPMKGRKFSENVELAVDMPEPTFPESPEEIDGRHERRIKMGTMSIIDAIKENNPDLDDDQAAARLEEIAKEQAMFKGASVLGAIGLDPEGGE